MSLTISQIVASSYPAVVNKMRASNQWAESAFLSELERQGAVVRKSLGPTIEATLDYRANTAAAFLATDMEDTGTTKTDVLTAASYEPALLSVPVIWSKGDEVKNPEENQKVALVKKLLKNGIDSHDDLIEEALFSTSTNGFLGLATIVPTDGQGTVGGISAVTETFWRNQTGTYTDDSDIEAGMNTLWNACAKGSGSSLTPKIIVSGSTAQATFEATQAVFQRYESQELKAGFRTLMYKTARYVFSQYGSTKLYFLNPESFRMEVSKQQFRSKGDVVEFANANGYSMKIFSGLQTITDNKSRLGVLYIA